MSLYKAINELKITNNGQTRNFDQDGNETNDENNDPTKDTDNGATDDTTSDNPPDNQTAPTSTTTNAPTTDTTTGTETDPTNDDDPTGDTDNNNDDPFALSDNDVPPVDNDQNAPEDNEDPVGDTDNNTDDSVSGVGEDPTTDTDDGGADADAANNSDAVDDDDPTGDTDNNNDDPLTNDSEGGDENTNTTDDTNTDDISTGGEDNELQQREKELFKDLTPEQFEIKNKELKGNYIELYNAVLSIIDRVNSIQLNSKTSKVVEFIIDQLDQLKEMIPYYLNNTYNTKTYIQNSINYQEYLVVINTIRRLLDKINKENNDSDKNRNSN